MAPAGPSEDWTEYDSSTAPPEVTRVIEHGDWKHLCAKAVSKHPAQGGKLTCTANLTRFAQGQCNIVIELSFSDGSYWVARVVTPLNDSGVEDRIEWMEKLMLSGIATMRLVAQRTSLPVPIVYSYDTDPHNTFGFRYVLMSALPGKKMKAPLYLTVPDDSRKKVTDQMAGYVNELSQITFPQLGYIFMGPDMLEAPEIIALSHSEKRPGPFTSSRAYFANWQQIRSDKLERLYHEDDDWSDWLTYCKVQSSAVPLLVRPELRRGPFPLNHQDLHFNNMLFDDDFNITGILDWDYTGTTPWEQVGLIDDIMPSKHFDIADNDKILMFRDAFIDSYKQVESPIPAGKGVLLSSILESPLPFVVARFLHPSPPMSKFAKSSALDLLRLLFGAETTFENYKVRRNRQRGKPIPRVAVWGKPPRDNPVTQRVSKRVNKGVRKR